MEKRSHDEKPSKKKGPTKFTDLSDHHISAILSLLPTKECVRTSILSKEWKNLWTKVSVLDFDDEIREIRHTSAVENKKRRFSDFVHSVIMHVVLLNYDSPKIKKFHLRGFKYSNKEIANWLCEAAAPGLEEAELSFTLYTPAICSGLLDRTTLTVLRLNKVSLSPMKYIDSVSLPNLKTLYLGDVQFYKHYYLVRLLLGCPSVEDLVLESPHVCCLLDDYCTFENIDVTLNSLTRTKLNFPWEPHCQIRELFKTFCNVESITISSAVVESLVYSYPTSFPMNLNNLHVEISFEDYLWGLLVTFLQRSSKLESLVIQKAPTDRRLYRYVPDEITQEMQWTNPNNHPLTLKSLFIRDYEGWPAELDFVRYVMENSDSLERLVISFAASLPRKVENSIRGDCCSVVPLSPTCRIEFVDDDDVMKRKIEERC